MPAASSALHPRTVLKLMLVCLLAGLAGWRSATIALVCVLCAAPLAPRRLGKRLVPLAGSSVVVLVVLPLAPREATEILVRGLAASLAVVVLGSRVAWPAAVAELQRVGLPCAAVAFLALVARHLEVLAGDATTVVAVMRIRGAFARRRDIPQSVSVLVARLLALAWLRADRVADAMAVRGFEGRLPPNSAWRPRATEARHYALTLVALGALAWEIAR